jgi:hypothetical protein
MPGERAEVLAVAAGAQTPVYGLKHGTSNRYPRGIEIDVLNIGAATGNVTLEGSFTPIGPWRVIATWAQASPAPQRAERSIPFWRANNGLTGPGDIYLRAFD